MSQTEAERATLIERSAAAFKRWRLVPAPVRGEYVRRMGEAFRRDKERLAFLVTMEARKIPSEALGEVQEVIDVCDFAVGLSRQLHGLTIASERPSHRMMEQWHPLGPVGVITAFNFPVAVWAWNAMLALVCGDSVIWKPSQHSQECALFCWQLALRVAREMDPKGDVIPEDLLGLFLGGPEVAKELAASPLVPLVSATGSTEMGREVAKIVSGRLGRTILELGGNNAMYVGRSANLDLAARAIVFSAVGTCGQRCTTLRRLIVHKEVYLTLMSKLLASYGSLPIGDPSDHGTLVGPLIDSASVARMSAAVQRAKTEGGTVLFGDRAAGHFGDREPPAGCVVPTIILMPGNTPVVREETFAPILYVMSCNSVEEAIVLNNDVPQGLSSAIFTNEINEAELFMSAAGSDCGIANVNIGTSGAEIGGAFGGEKDTGGGRESGSDSWKQYMRRATNTINYGSTLPLAQGVNFGS